MALDFFESLIDNQPKSQREYYHDANQAFIDDVWDNTAVVKIVEEQNMTCDGTFPEFSFHCTEAWIDGVIGQNTTSKKNGDDYANLKFQCLDHPCVRGRYYKFADNYWIADFTDENNDIFSSVNVRRCNNVLRRIDPENGSIYTIPCCIDYDMQSPSLQVTRYVNTPNSHAVIMVQANDEVQKLFKLNTRIMLEGRPFKLLAQQDTILDNLTNKNPTLMYFHFYLDELHAQDDIENQLAYNGDFNYKLIVNNKATQLQENTKGKFNVDVTLNDKEVKKDIVWESNNDKVVQIDQNGNYEVVGKAYRKAIITAYLKGNKEVFDSFEVEITKEVEQKIDIIVDPVLNTVRQGETIQFTLSAVCNGIEYSPDVSQVSLIPDGIELEDENVKVVKNKNTYKITCKQRALEAKNIYLFVENYKPKFNANQVVSIKLASLFG